MDMDIVVKDMIQRIRKVNENAFIAGGFVRDFLMKNPGYRDVDIFVPIKHNEDYINSIEVLLTRNTFGDSFLYRATTQAGRDYTGMSMRIPRVYHCTFFGIPLDVVPYQLQKGEDVSVEDIVRTFDFGINQCSYDGDNTFCTDAAIADMRNRTLTLLNLEGLDKLPKIMHQANRLCALYGLTFRAEEILQLKARK